VSCLKYKILPNKKEKLFLLKKVFTRNILLQSCVILSQKRNIVLAFIVDSNKWIEPPRSEIKRWKKGNVPKKDNFIKIDIKPISRIFENKRIIVTKGTSEPSYHEIKAIVKSSPKSARAVLYSSDEKQKIHIESVATHDSATNGPYRHLIHCKLHTCAC
jgi:hypothetical protein